LGANGLGHCNHAGAILFAVEDFCRSGLRDHGEPISCTSKICKWNVPRNINVTPKPVDDINFVRHQFGKESNNVAKSSLYDPRAPCDRGLNEDALNTLSDNIASCMSSSSYFLFHKVKPKCTNSNIQIDSYWEDVPEECLLESEGVSEGGDDCPFNDIYDISSKEFKEMMQIYMQAETISDYEIERIERTTRGQSDNELWRELKRTKLTAPNFYSAATRKSAPDKMLKNIMYLSPVDTNNTIAALQYGITHEQDAADAYVKAKEFWN